MNIFNLFFLQPILNLLIFFYNFFPIKDIGFSVIFLTIFIKVLLFPVSLSIKKSQEKLNLLQPQIETLQKKLKKAQNPEEQKKIYQEIIEIYKKEKINPFSSLVPTIFQFFVLITLFTVFKNLFSKESLNSLLYPFLKQPENINFSFLNIIDLSKPNFFLAILVAILQYFQIKIYLPKNLKEKNDFINLFQKQMLFLMPLMIFLILLKTESIFGLYWILMITLSILEEKYFFVKILKSKK